MKVLLINMDKDTERLERMKIRLKGIDFERVPGVEHDQGYIGCFMAHQKCWQKIVNENLESALILEDDVIFKREIFKTEIPTCDVYYLGYIKAHYIVGTHCYVVSLSGAKKLLDMKIDDHVDLAISRNSQLNIVLHHTSLCNQESLDSSIAKKDGMLLVDTLGLSFTRYSNIMLFIFVLAGGFRLPLIFLTLTPKLWIAFFMGLLVNVYAKSAFTVLG